MHGEVTIECLELKPIYFRREGGIQVQVTNSAASFCRFVLSISEACSHLDAIRLGASFEYRINAATTNLYPGDDLFSNFTISLWP